MEKHQFKILSIDGGGIRGIIPCTILAFIEDQIGTLSNTFDLMAGTSTGGIIALGLAMPNEQGDNAYHANDMLELYVRHGKDIFKGRKEGLVSFAGSGLDLVGSALKPVGNVLHPGLGDALKGATTGVKTATQNPYDERNIENIMREKFGNTRLKECLTAVLATTYEITKEKAFYFLSRLAREKEAENLELWEIARSTSAAPTYFTPSIVKWQTELEVFVDGGVFANNPSVLAYGEAKELWKRKGQLAFEPDVLPNDNDLPFFMLSLGTGHCPQYISSLDALKFNTAQWIQPLLTNVFMNSVASSTHFTMQHLLPKYTDGMPRYERLEFEIPEKNKEMDDASDENIEQLQELAQDYIKANKKKIMNICEYLSA